MKTFLAYIVAIICGSVAMYISLVFLASRLLYGVWEWSLAAPMLGLMVLGVLAFKWKEM